MDLVKVKLFAAAKSAAQLSEVDVDSGTLGEILSQLISDFPKLASVIPQCSYLVNEVACNDSDFFIEGGSQIDILPRFAGGSR